MAGDVGLRELKRRRTRETLIGAAVGLFDRYGYEAVTVTQIAAAAGVSRKTFFNYFPGKEDVVFGNPQRRLEAALRVIAGRAREPPAAALVAAVEEMLRYAGEDDLVTGMAATRLRLITAVPALQAAALRRFAAAAGQLTGALHAAYRPQLDEDSAAILVGAVLGAVLAASAAGLRRGEPPAELAASVRGAASTVAWALRPQGPGKPAVCG